MVRCSEGIEVSERRISHRRPVLEAGVRVSVRRTKTPVPLNVDAAVDGRRPRVWDAGRLVVEPIAGSGSVTRIPRQHVSAYEPKKVGRICQALLVFSSAWPHRRVLESHRVLRSNTALGMPTRYLGLFTFLFAAFKRCRVAKSFGIVAALTSCALCNSCKTTPSERKRSALHTCMNMHRAEIDRPASAPGRLLLRCCCGPLLGQPGRVAQGALPQHNLWGQNWAAWRRLPQKRWSAACCAT